MHTLLLCLWVLGIVSAADDQSQRPIYIISPKGAPPGYSNGQPFFGAPVSSNSVKVLPNAYKSTQGADQSSESPLSVPVIVNTNTFQGNTNQPIPVPVDYSDNTEPSLQPTVSTLTQSPQDIKSLPIQRPPYPGVTPVPVLVKAPAPAFHPVTSTPRPFQANPQQYYDSSSENPFAAIAPSFRLWPKLPEPIPVPVLSANAFVRNSYRNLNTNLIPQKVPLKVSSSKYQQNQGFRSLDYSQFQTQPQSNNQGPIYIIVPGDNTNTQSDNQYQNPTPTYQSQAPQNQRVFILVQPNANFQPNPSYQNEGFSSNQYFGRQQGQFASPQQAPLNYAVLAPNSPGGQSQSQSVEQQSALKYAIFGPENPGISTDLNRQTTQNHSVFTPDSQSPKTATQSPLIYAELRSADGKSTVLPSTTSPLELFGQSSAQPSTSQNSGSQPPSVKYFSSSTSTPSTLQNFRSSTSSPPLYLSHTQSTFPQTFGSTNQSPLQYFGSSTQSPLQYFGSSTQSPLQYFGSSTQSPQKNIGSSTPSPQFYFSPSTQSTVSQNFGATNQSPLQYFGSPSQSPFAENFRQSSSRSPFIEYFDSTTQYPSPRYVVSSSSSQSPASQYFGSSTPPSQFFGFSSTQSPSPFTDYSSSTQQPQYAGFSATQATSQPSYSQSPSPISRVSFSGAGNSYSYSIK